MSFILFFLISCGPDLSPSRVTSIHLDGLGIKIKYASPSARGRDVWNNLVPYNQVWRTGANEAATIQLSRDALFNGHEVKAASTPFLQFQTIRFGQSF